MTAKPWMMLVYIALTTIVIVLVLKQVYVFTGMPYWLYITLAGVFGGINGYYARRIVNRIMEKT